jgi:hypothetical protein
MLDPTGTRTPTLRSSSPWPVAKPTALSRLRCSSSVVAITKCALKGSILGKDRDSPSAHVHSPTIGLQIAYGKRFLGLNRPQNETNHSLPSGAEVNNSKNILFGSPYAPTWRNVCAQEQFLREREREREREKGGGVVVVRDTTLVGGMETLFPFEGSQAMPASPSDKGEV